VFHIDKQLGASLYFFIFFLAEEKKQLQKAKFTVPKETNSSVVL